jgi:hypothetical protein
MSVLISPNVKRESVRMDANGNVFDPKTNQKIRMVDPPYVPTPEEVANLTKKQTEPSVQPEVGKPLDLAAIQASIKSLEDQLLVLKELRKEKVAEMKKLLAEAESE